MRQSRTSGSVGGPAGNRRADPTLPPQRAERPTQPQRTQRPRAAEGRRNPTPLRRAEPGGEDALRAEAVLPPPAVAADVPRADEIVPGVRYRGRAARVDVGLRREE